MFKESCSSWIYFEKLSIRQKVKAFSKSKGLAMQAFIIEELNTKTG